MLYQNYSFEQSQNHIFYVLKELQIAKLLYKANIRKGCGLSALEMFQRLVMLVFHGKNLFHSLESKHNDHAVSKNTYYRFLSNPSFNWKKFLLLMAVRVTTALRKLTCKSRVTVLVLDDSVLRRNRNKAVELLAKVYDHVFHEFVRGFNLLALGWSDGFSFIPVSFVLLSSAKLRNRYQEADKDIDHRTNGWKARMESMLQKTEAALRMVESALAAGIHADYILMDSWFTTEPFVKSLSDLGQDVIGMVKDLKQRYDYNGRLYTLPRWKAGRWYVMTLDNLSRKAVILYGLIQGCGGGVLDEWQMRDKTGLSHGSICAARKELVNAGLLTLGKDGRRTTYILTSQAEKSTGTQAEPDRMTEPAPAEAAVPVEATETKAVTAPVEVPPPPAVKAGLIKPAAQAAEQAEMPRVAGVFNSFDDWLSTLTMELGGCVNASESLITPP